MARTAFLAAAALLSLVASSPLTPRETNGTCTQLCLINSPPKLDLPDCENRFDELVYAHIIQSNWIHNTSSFLPWHRYFIRGGKNPSTPATSPAPVVFNTTTGFGGQGDDCVTDGPFANLTLSLNSYDGGSVYSSEYCLSRSFSDNTFELGNDTYIEECMAETNYTGALDCLTSTPHAAGHGGVGGTMLDVSASPAEPLFFLHHTNLDRLWWNWQQASPDNRTYDIGSERNTPLYSYASSMNFSYPSSSLIDYSGDDGNITTLNHVLWIAEIVPNVTINDVMDLSGETICAEYV